MRERQWWLIGSALVTVAALALGWLLGAAPLLDAARSADANRAGVEAQNATYGLQLTQLREQYKGIDALTAQLSALRTALPVGTAFPAYDGELISTAQQSAVTILDVTVSDAVPYAPAIVDESTAAAETPTDDTAAATTGVPPSSPLVTTENFVAIPITIVVAGDYANVLNFLGGVQTGSRLTTVASFDTVQNEPAPGVVAGRASEGTVTGTLSVLVYVLRDDTTVG